MLIEGGGRRGEVGGGQREVVCAAVALVTSTCWLDRLSRAENERRAGESSAKQSNFPSFLNCSLHSFEHT